MRKLLILLLLNACFAGFVHAQNKDLDVAVQKLIAVMVNPDSVALEKMLSPQLSYGHSSGKVQTKQEFIHALLSGESDFVGDITLGDQKTVVQGNTALVRHRLSANTNDRNVAGHVELYILLIWTKEKTGWKLLGRQAVKVP